MALTEVSGSGNGKWPWPHNAPCHRKAGRREITIANYLEGAEFWYRCLFVCGLHYGMGWIVRIGILDVDRKDC